VTTDEALIASLNYHSGHAVGDLFRLLRDAAARLSELRGERDEAYRNVDENWITHQRVVAAEARATAAEARAEKMREALEQFPFQGRADDAGALWRAIRRASEEG
jgi:uncharacterized membrane protein YccC